MEFGFNEDNNNNNNNNNTLTTSRRGVVASVVRRCRMNEVTLCRARLVLGWVTVFGLVYHHGM